jgi:hypothetical protein
MLRIPLLFVLLLLQATAIWAQGSTGAVTGIVTDPSGAVVPKANVELRNLQTGVVLTTTTTDAGVYTFPSVPRGTFDLSIQAPGFARFTANRLLVEVATTVRVDATLKVGSEVEMVTVAAELPLLQAETSSNATVVNRNLLDRVPFQLSGTNRDVTSFIRLVPGVDGSSGNFRLNIAGGRQHTNEVLVDGMTNTYRAAVNTPFSVRPSFSSVSEFRVEVAVPPAEYGRTSSGVILMTTKSGTNEFHGGMDFLLRNNKFDSRRFNQASADVTRQGEGTATLGGPVVLPKLYNGRNRTFFFTDLMVFRRINQPQGVLDTYPTELMRRGDFSATGRTIYDPLTGAAGQNRTPFAGNAIPANRISNFARALLPVIPSPNLPTPELNFIGVQNIKENQLAWMLKIDHRFNDHHSITSVFRYNWMERFEDRSASQTKIHSNFYNDFPTAYHGLIHWDWIIRPTVLNKLSFGGTDWFSDFRQTPPIAYTVPNAFGAGFPALRFTANNLTAIGANVDRTVHSRIYNIQDALSWTRGAHNFKFGFRYDHQQDNTQTLGNKNGTYTFAPFASGLAGAATSGHAFASFLLAAPQTANMQFGLPYLARSPALGIYAQDDWKVTRRLTLNYGLRYERQTPWYDRDGNNSTFDLNTPNPGAGNRPGAMVFAGSGPGRLGRTQIINNFTRGWGPRLGAAYQLTSTTVFRAGAGVFYAPRRYAPAYTQGYSANVTLASLDGGFTPPFSLDTGWPAGVAVKPPFISPTLVNNQAANYVNPDANNGSGRLGTTYQMQVNLQQRIRNSLVEVGWISTQGRNVPNATLENLNQVDPQFLSLGSLLGQNINSAAVQAAGFRPPFPGFNGTLAQALRPYPQVQTIRYDDAPSGNSNYHALVAKYEQRFTSGLTVLAAYTFSKLISDVEMVQSGTLLLQNAFDRRSERSVANIDIPHRLVTSFAYELPFGKGKPWLSAGAGAWVLGGWSLSGILTYESAMPTSVRIPNGLPIFNGQLRPNLNAGVDPYVKRGYSGFRPGNALTGETGDVAFNRAAFSTPAPFTFGNLGPFVGWLRGFYNRYEDFSLAKRFPLGEARFVEIRSDWFNAFNRTNFSAPIADLTSVNFGRTFSAGPMRTIQFGARFAF